MLIKKKVLARKIAFIFLTFYHENFQTIKELKNFNADTVVSPSKLYHTCLVTQLSIPL